MSSSAEVEVLSGRLPSGEDWVVQASGDTDELMTMVEISRADEFLAGKGFGGPGLAPESVLNSYWGKTEDLPYVVLVRVAATVDRVVAETSTGRIELSLSEPHQGFNRLRFGFAALSGPAEPQRIIAMSGGRELESWPPDPGDAVRLLRLR